MMADVNYQGQAKRTKRAEIFWRQILDDYNSGRSAQEIAEHYINPQTGNNYTRAHIYWVLDKMKNK